MACAKELDGAVVIDAAFDFATWCLIRLRYCLPLLVCVTVIELVDDLAEYTGSKPSDFDLSWLV